MSIKFTTLASGSAGNSVYIGTPNTKILIDAGISGTKIENSLSSINVSIKDIDAIFITHEHHDHIEGVGVLSRRYNIPVYATEGTWDNMPQKVGKIIHKNIIYKDENIYLNDIYLRAFEIPHDAKDPVCYSIFYDNIKICVLTDMGYITENIIKNAMNSNTLLIESNHDVDMVKNGNYPTYLKKRVLGKYGHISNETCAKLLYCVMNDKIKDVFIGHISTRNNTPELAYISVTSTLDEFGVRVEKDIFIHIAKPYGVNKIIEINT